MDAEGRVSRVKEKEAISPHASTGTYYFRSSVLLLDLIESAMSRQDTVNGEYYLGPLYNTMIAQGLTVTGCPVKRFISFGTPEDLARSESNSGDAEAIQRLADRMSKPATNETFM